MSKIDLNKNRQALLSAFNDVSDVKTATDWAVFGYEGQANVLKLVEKGDGGIEEMTEDLSGGKIQYAYCRVMDPNTNLPKFVLINWQGEGAPETRKGTCANHVRDVASFFRGAHVTINARTEEDVDEDLIKDKVAKSSGSNYGFHKEKAKPAEPILPVGTNYKRTRADAEIKRSHKDDFWDEQRQLEQQRQEQEVKTKQEIVAKEDRERREREAEEAKERDRKERERMKYIDERKDQERRDAAAKAESDRQKWDEQQQSAYHDEEERKKRSDNMRKQRASEAQSLVGQREFDPKSRFQQKTTSQFDDKPRGPPPPRKLKHGFMEQDDPLAQPVRKAPIQLPKAEETSPESPPSPPAARTEPPRLPPPRSQPPAPTPMSDPTPPVTSPTAEQPKVKNLLAASVPARPPSDDEGNQEWEEEEEVSKPTAVVTSPQGFQDEQFYDEAASAASAQSQHTEPPAQQQPDDVYEDAREQPLYEDTFEPTQQQLYEDTVQPTQPAQQLGADKGQCARALYDYQATEEGEITFDPDDIITNIDQIDPGWWTGVAPDGTHGMFPSNYVELM